MKKQLIGVILMGVVVISAVPQTSKAAQVEQINADESISICSEYISYSKTILSITDGTAKITVQVKGIPSFITKIHAKIVLQKYSNDSWEPVKSYEDTVSTYIYSMDKTKAVSKGKYRVKGIYTMYKGEKVEEITQYSSTVTYN